MKFSFRSAAPERDWSPISKVPPSPAKARTVVSSSPLIFRAQAMPAAVGAAISKAEWKQGTVRVLFGEAALITPTQEGMMTTMVFSPRTFKTNRMVAATPQPGQAICPGRMVSFSIVSITMVFHLLNDRIKMAVSYISSFPPRRESRQHSST